MSIKTEDMVPGLPGKEMLEDIDWLSILDSFDPSTLIPKYLNECARRNPYYTCYGWDTLGLPFEDRIAGAKVFAGYDRRDLEECVERIEQEGVTELTYRKARAALIKAIGSKGAVEYIRQQAQSLGEEDKRQIAEDYRIWKEKWQAEIQMIDEAYEAQKSGRDYYADYDFEEVDIAPVHEKIVMIRKGIKASNGKPLVQRDFAKLLGYQINKYADAEKTDRSGRGVPESEVEYELLEKLVMVAHANPYWLFDPSCMAYETVEDMNDNAVRLGDAPCVYAPLDVILRWIREGKPQVTDWMKGCF